MKIKNLFKRIFLVILIFFSFTKINVTIAQTNADEYFNNLIQISNSKDLDKKIGELEKQISSICDSTITFLQSYKKDTSDIAFILNILVEEKENYKELLSNDAVLIDMSYGNPLIAKEARRAASKGFYYFALNEKYKFLKAVYDNSIENFINTNK